MLSRFPQGNDNTLINSEWNTQQNPINCPSDTLFEFRNSPRRPFCFLIRFIWGKDQKQIINLNSFIQLALFWNLLSRNLLEFIAQLARGVAWEQEVGKTSTVQNIFFQFVWLVLSFEKNLPLPPPPGYIALDFG